MSAFTIAGLILAILAGIINLGVGVLRIKHRLLALMRFGIAIACFAIAAGIVILKANDVSLTGLGVTGATKIAYLAMGLAIFVGGTLMLPASIERNNLPAEERLTPTTHPSTPPTPRTTGALSSDGGVRVANQGDDWVN
jgi:hypothetical protein